MKKIIPLLMAVLAFIPASAVTITCVDEGNNIVRIDYDSTGEISLPKAFGLNVTVDNGAVIQQVFDYKVGDSNITSLGYGIFPGTIKINDAGQIIDWGKPDVNDGSLGTLGGTGTSGVTLLMTSRYSGSENAPRVKDTLCRILVDTGSAQTVNVQIGLNSRLGGIVLENAAIAQFTGIGCTITSVVTPPPGPTPPPKPISISYPESSDTGKYTVSWLASQGATSYHLERSNDGGSTWAELYSGPDRSYSEAVSDGNYRYRVNAQNSIGSSDWLTGLWNCIVTISELPPSTPVEVIVDNLDPTTSSVGTWAVSGATGFHAANSVWSRTSGASFTFSASLVSGATYDVYEWHNAWPSRYTAVPHQVRDGATLLQTLNVNQTQNTSQWHYLGTYTFTNGSASVTILVAPGAASDQWSTNADAVRFVPAASPVPTEVIVDNLTAGNTSTGTWAASGASGFWASNSVWSRTAGGSFTFNASIRPGTSYQVYEWHNAWPSRYTAVPHQIRDGSTLLGTVNVNQR